MQISRKPIEMNFMLEILPNQAPIDIDQYQRLVGVLIYMPHMRLDITYVSNILSKFMHITSEEHTNATYRIMRYFERRSK